MTTAYIKLTNWCTVGCEHCYLPEEVRANRSVMSPSVMDAVTRMIAELAVRNPSPDNMLRLVFHGGEPLMLDRQPFDDFLSRMADWLDQINYTGPVQCSIQTSLMTYRTSRHADLIHEYFESQVGSSIDFSQRSVNGSVDRYHETWMRQVERARADGILVMPGAVPAKGYSVDGRQFIDWMAERDFTFVQIEKYNAPGLMRHVDQNVTTNAEHSAFLIQAFDRVMERFEAGLWTPVVRQIGAAINGVLHLEPGDRWGGSCQSDYVVINPDGSTNSCLDRMEHEPSFANALEGTDAFLSSPLRRKWIRIQQVEHRNAHCADCRFSSWCKGGCPIAPQDEREECAGFNQFLSHIARFVETQHGRDLACAYLEHADDLTHGRKPLPEQAACA